MPSISRNFPFLLVFIWTSLYYETMKYAEKMLLCLTGTFVLCSGASALVADSSNNPYQDIVIRNVFQLKPAPVPIPVEPPKPPLPKVSLKGIFTILGRKSAIMSANFPAKDGKPAGEQSFTLSVGEREGEFEVLDINKDEGIVKIKISETTTNITFEKIASGGGGPASPPPGPAGIGSGAPPNPYLPAAGGIRQIPTRRDLRLPGSTSSIGSPTGGGAYGAMASTASYGGANYGGANYGSAPAVAAPNGAQLNLFGSAPAPIQPEQPQQQGSLEEREIMVEANYQVAKQQGHFTADLFPPSLSNPTRNVAPGNGEPEGDAANGQNGTTPGQPTLPTPGRPRFRSGF
jgi:hypothetical protein